MKPGQLQTQLWGMAMVLVAGSSLLTACTQQRQMSAPSGSAMPMSMETPSKEMEQGKMPSHGMGTMSHNMDLGPADTEYDLRFVDAMIPHHEGAIVMAEEVKQKSKRPELLKLADSIIQAQNKEIKQMKQWRQAWYPTASQEPIAWHAQMGHSMAMSPEQMQGMMMSMDLGSADKQFDLRFLNAMIPHHEGALVMAEDALKKSKRTEMRQLAQAILTSQQAEIDQMKQWRKAWYNQ